MSLIDLYKHESISVFLSIPNAEIEALYRMILDCYKSGNHIFVCGNGGSIGCIVNIVADFNLHPFVSDDKRTMDIGQKRLWVIDLTSNASLLTALSNDIGSDAIYSEQLRFMAKPGDLLLALSGSGNSGNIVRACSLAKSLMMKTVLVTRNASSKASSMCDFVMCIRGSSCFPGQTGSNNNNFHYEDCLMKISHIITGLLRQEVQGAKPEQD